MSLEEAIVHWSSTRPPWQRLILRQLTKGESLSHSDYEQLIADLLTSDLTPDVPFGLEHLPHSAVGDPAVKLASISDPEHVNALTSEKPLAFEQTGMTIVYGNNGSGKSGYARLLKRIARSRHREEILSDVFRDTSVAKPKALLTVQVGQEKLPLSWPESTPPELQRMLFYDRACGDAYIDTESTFPYRPSVLFVLDGLIEVCTEIRTRIDEKLQANASSSRRLPSLPEEMRETEVVKYLANLSGSSSLEALDALSAEWIPPGETLDELKKEEARLLSADATKERQHLIRQASKLNSLRIHLESLQLALGDDVVVTLQEQRELLRNLEEAAGLAARSYDSEPVRGVGTSPWKELWESARRFSQSTAYPDNPYPMVGNSAKCVLCHQALKEEARARLLRFEQFIRDNTQTRLRHARKEWDKGVHNITSTQTTPQVAEANLQDLQPDHKELVAEVRTLLGACETARGRLIQDFSGNADLSRSGLTSVGVNARLEAAENATRDAAEALSHPKKTADRLEKLTRRKAQLEFLNQLKSQRHQVGSEIARLKEREALETAKNVAATGLITKKVSELSAASVTEVLRDTFTRETDRLRLERVTMTKTRAEKGAVLHQPKLVGARQSVRLPRVFSEGERTALGLAAFFAEAHLEPSKSALILDDPVTSLDHVRRELVATRLCELAETRQVIVFTHDVSFVADLKREAKRFGVLVGERSIVRARGGDRKPGACSTKHPWKARDVKERLGDLRDDLGRISKESKNWDDTEYEDEVATWAGKLSETWERIFSQEVVGPILAEGGLEVRPNMVKLLASFTSEDDSEFQASYSRISQWVKRHDKSGKVNYVAPEIGDLQEEFDRVETWFNRVRKYKDWKPDNQAMKTGGS